MGESQSGCTGITQVLGTAPGAGNLMVNQMHVVSPTTGLPGQLRKANIKK